MLLGLAASIQNLVISQVSKPSDRGKLASRSLKDSISISRDHIWSRNKLRWSAKWPIVAKALLDEF